MIVKRTSLILSFLLILFAGGLWAESLDGTYICEPDTYWDGSKSFKSSVLEVKGETLKVMETTGENVFKRIYEHYDSSQFGSGENHKVFVAVSGNREYRGSVIMINKTTNNRINVSQMEPYSDEKRNRKSYADE